MISHIQRGDLRFGRFRRASSELCIQAGEIFCLYFLCAGFMMNFDFFVSFGRVVCNMNVQPADRLRRLPEQFFSALVRKANSYIEKGYDVINLGQGNPDLPTPPHIVEAMREAVLDPVTHRYSPFSGLPELKEAIAAWYKAEFDVNLDPSTEVAILFGGKVGLVEISQCLLNKGDICLVPDPGYPDYWSGVAMSGGC